MVSTRYFYGFVAFVVITHMSCFRFDSRAKLSKPQLDRLSGYSSDRIELDDIASFYKKVFGSSSDGYWEDWARLKTITSGEVIPERIPYVDSWYPEKTGGTNIVREGQSQGALDKYDDAFHGGTSTAAKWEADNNSRQEPDWYGHCNGTSVAASRYQNPVNSVFRPSGCSPGPGCVEFTPYDIRALLAEISMNAKAKFISGNRCRKTKEEFEAEEGLSDLRQFPQTMDACDDINPGSFHIGLVNFLGRQKQPLIFDRNRDEEVWNYPIYRFSTSYVEGLSESEAVQIFNCESDRLTCDRKTKIQSWIFNDSAVSYVYVTTTISFRRAVEDFTGAGSRPEPIPRTYYYILEQGAEGNILGGEWVGVSDKDHPDFLWMAFEPAEPNGTSSRGNPFVSNDEVIKLWAESVGFDPENPFRDKPSNPYDVRFYPRRDLEWGLVEGYYQLVLDGRTSGSVFTDKPTHLRILTADVIGEGAEVTIRLNGQNLETKKVTSGKVDIVFDAPSGINTLKLDWNSPNVANKELAWEFDYFGM
ncbi:MAG: hypothetical protein HRU19_09310 [Pseudobacteriovorax sp.]|nr:hypothetical protein [Pseudobacteriovorax sp.]